VAGGVALAALMGVAAHAGMIGAMLRALFHAVLGAGAAYYGSFVILRRIPVGALTQVWGLLGAGIGIALGTASWPGVLAGLLLAGGSLFWASRQTVVSSPATTDELSAHGYLPFGVGLSIAAVVLAYSGGFEWVRELFTEIATGIG
jgi:hypothetical protein